MVEYLCEMIQYQKFRYGGCQEMSLANYFPIYNKLNKNEREILEQYSTRRSAPAGTILYNGEPNCLGLLVICSGQIRTFLMSAEGREVTLYRLFEHDICLFSASCALNSVQFSVTIEVEKDAEFWVIPASQYRKLMDSSVAVSNYTNQLMATRFTDVMWLMEQVMWKSMDKRLAGFLLEESNIEETQILKITHEKIAAHMGTAREVVTRMLKYFQTEGIVKLTRGAVEILDEKRLKELVDM